MERGSTPVGSRCHLSPSKKAGAGSFFMGFHSIFYREKPRLVLAGSCALHRSVEEVARPLLVTILGDEKKGGKGKGWFVLMISWNQFFFWLGDLHWAKSFFCWGWFLLEDFSEIDEFTAIYGSVLGDFFRRQRFFQILFLQSSKQKIPLPIGP